MATDVEVQYFSHLNGLVLGNNWGDLIRLLDKALVTGIDFTQITAASIDAQGDVSITLFAAHNAMLFQVVELSGFTPNSLNQKYRIKGVPNTTQLILKPALDITERSITTMGTGKLASLGYDIIFRDTNDVKRVYRAKNPTAQHPFIRVDESLTSPDGSSGIYSSTYAKFAMVGLLENMDHIDDFENPNVLQLPLDPSNPEKNWKITGVGNNVIRGWSRWYYSRGYDFQTTVSDENPGSSAAKKFTLVGDKNAFYFQRGIHGDTPNYKVVSGCGLLNESIDSTVIPPWFLMTTLANTSASTTLAWGNIIGGLPLLNSENNCKFFMPTYDVLGKNTIHTVATPILFTYRSGNDNSLRGNNISALEVPAYDSALHLRGTLKHIAWAGQARSVNGDVLPVIGEKSMYIYDSAFTQTVPAGFYYYLGEI